MTWPFFSADYAYQVMTKTHDCQDLMATEPLGQTGTLADAGGCPEDVFIAHLPIIDALISAVARRHRLSRPETEEFRSIVHLRLIENDYSVIRQFRGTSSLRTYLAVVISRHYLDFRVASWGRWRASANAKRLGTTAVTLERLLRRDGLTVDEAYLAIRASGQDVTREQLRGLAEHFPHRMKYRCVQEYDMEGQVATPANQDVAFVLKERRRVVAGLMRSLRGLDSSDRRLLSLRFFNGLSIADIARREGLQQPLLYRQVARVLQRLRRELKQLGIDAQDFSRVHELL